MFTQAIGFDAHVFDLHARSSSGASLSFYAAVCGLVALLALGLADPAEAQSEARTLAQADAVETPAEEAAEAAPEEAVEPVVNALEIVSPTWRAHFGEQVAQMLREGGPAAEDDTVLRDVIVVAGLDRNGISLSSALGPLLQILEHDSSETRRLMALQALSAIGTEHSSTLLYRQAMEQVYQVMQEEESSERVRRGAAEILNDLYAGKK